MTKYFIITSHGWSASNWLSYALNIHGEITASHSAANLIDTRLTNDIKGNIKEFHEGYVNRQSISIDDSYDRIEKSKTSLSYGSVHLYRLRDLPVLNDNFGPPARKFNIINLIRNPITLVWSGYNQFLELFKTDINELYWTTGKVLEDKDFIYSLTDKYDLLPGEYENLAFLGAARVLGSLRLDLNALDQVKSSPFLNYQGEVKMEDITNQPESLKSLIHTISDNTIDVSADYLDKVYSLGKINKHKKSSKSLSPEALYFSLESWQKETLNFYLKKYSIVKPYEQFGYDLSFLYG